MQGQSHTRSRSYRVKVIQGQGHTWSRSHKVKVIQGQGHIESRLYRAKDGNIMVLILKPVLHN